MMLERRLAALGALSDADIAAQVAANPDDTLNSTAHARLVTPLKAAK